jgi:caa(3)-type oxidase subunit IV
MEHKHDNHSHHIIPLKIYFGTLIALLVLTVVTVGASYVNFGSTMNVVVSMGIASVKASLVLLFFMGLKYDTNLNRAYILSSFVALALLLFFTATDLWTRPKPMPVVVKASEGPLSEKDFQALLVSNADLVAKGKGIYDVNCAVCHGAGGNGDGVGGAALNPKPRNFHAPSAEWKNGSSTKAMYVTLANGIPGGGMASYKALPVADRVALIHYVHTFVKDVEAVSKADAQFAQAVKEDGVGGEGSGPAKSAVPVDFAIDRILN